MSGSASSHEVEIAKLQQRVFYLEKENDELKQMVEKSADAVQETKEAILEMKHTLDCMMRAAKPVNEDLMKVKEVADDYKSVKSKFLGGVTVLFFMFGVIWEVVKVAITKLSSVIGG